MQLFRQKIGYFLIAAVVIAFDQYTKYLALQYLEFASPVPVADFLNWTLLFNTGAAFSFLADAGGWQHWLLGGLAVLISVFIIVYLLQLPAQAYLLSFALALVLGGAIGNVYDRFTLGYVVDFIDVYINECGFFRSWFPACHWPAFNIADSAICVGAFLLLIDAIKNPEPAR